MSIIRITHEVNRKWIDSYFDPTGNRKKYLKLSIPAIHTLYNINSYYNVEYLGYPAHPKFRDFSDRIISFEYKEYNISFYPLFLSFSPDELYKLESFNEKIYNQFRNIMIALEENNSVKNPGNKKNFELFRIQYSLMKDLLPNVELY
jgi:hypothetical protein